MINSFALVKNLKSTSEELHFADFKLVKIESSFDYELERAKHLFPEASPSYEDWIYERSYGDSDGSDRISLDVEDALLLLRLFKNGDIFFVHPCIEYNDGSLSSQQPYPIMVYALSTNRYKIEFEECATFDSFASEILSLPNWSSVWFKTARRFFLYGGGKEYNPNHDLVDRIVDYMTTLEAILVPEDRSVGCRLRERAASLLNNDKIDIDVDGLLKDFYKVRSTVVHGGDISSFKDNVLIRNMDFEDIVRKIIVKALKSLPYTNNNRLVYLKQLLTVRSNEGAKVAKRFRNYKGRK